MKRALLLCLILAATAVHASLATGQDAPTTDPAGGVPAAPSLAPSTPAAVPATPSPPSATPAADPAAEAAANKSHALPPPLAPAAGPPTGNPLATPPAVPTLPLTIPGPGATIPPATGTLTPPPVGPALPAGTVPLQPQNPAGELVPFFQDGLTFTAPALPGATIEAGFEGNPRYIASQNVVLTWSENKDAVWGYSKSLGRWAKQTLDPPATKEHEVPVVGNAVAIWQIGTTFYAFSGAAARWDVLKLPAESKARSAVDDNYILVMDGDELHTFSVETGAWSSPQDASATTADTSGTSGTSEVRTFQLQHANAVTLEQTILRQLFADELRLGANHSGLGDTIIARGKPEALDQLEALLKVLDRPTRTGPGFGSERGTGGMSSMSGDAGGYGMGMGSEGYGSMSGAMPGMASDMMGSTGGMSGGPPSRAQLQRQQEDAERRAADEAQKLRRGKASASGGVLQPKALRAAVAEAFAARQRLHQHDLAALEMRLKSTRETLEMRERIKQQIIERRVADLLNPNLKWDTPVSTAQPVKDASVPPPGATSGVVPQGSSLVPAGAVNDVPTALRFASDLRGTWLQVAQERNGEASLVSSRTIFTLTFDGNRYTLRQGAEKYASGTFKVGGEVGQSRELDTVRTWLKGEIEETQRPQQELGLAQLNENTLQWCYGGMRANERPDKLATQKDDGRLLTEWRRLSYDPLTDEQFQSIDLQALAETPLAPASNQPTRSRRVRVRLAGLKGVTLASNAPGSKLFKLNERSYLSVQPGEPLLLSLSNFPGNEQLRLSAHLEVPALSARARKWAEVNFISLQVDSEDLDKAATDGPLVMATYLPQGTNEQAFPEMISTRHSPELDAVEEAKKRGDLLAVLTLSNVVPAAEASERGDELPRAATGSPLSAPTAENNRIPANEPPLILARSEEFQQRLSELYHMAATAQRIVDQHKALAADGNPQPQRFVDNALADLHSWQNKLDLAKAEYAAQLKLLESNLHSAEIAADAAQKSLDRTTKLFERGVTPASSLDEVRREAQETEARVQRAKTLLELYRRVDELSRPAAKSTPDEPSSPAKE